VHIPDGFINAGTSVGAGAISAGGIALATRRAAAALDDRLVPLTGLVSAFVFAAQMLNFPVAAGTSGHLVGGVLAAVLVGPWAGALCLTVVCLVQALFADGGLTALGLNVLNLALIGALGGYVVFVAVRALLPHTRGGVVAASGVAAGVSVVLGALAFVAEYALGGAGGADVATVATAMVGVHLLIGIGEGVITGATIAAVLGARPDLVFGARDLAPRAERPEPAGAAG
jgi:cobalt/nickel transport system permease protein